MPRDSGAWAFASANLFREKWAFIWDRTNTEGNTEAAIIEGHVTSTLVELRIPVDRVDGIIRAPKARGILGTSSLPGGVGNGGAVWFRDWAPDTGAGRDFDPSA